MLRRLGQTHVRPSLRPVRRYPRPTPRFFAQGVAQASNPIQLFDGLLLQVHEVTALPWVVSIPLTFILARSLFIPSRIRQATREKQQYILTPKLKALREIVEKQNKLRITAGIHDPQNGHEWKRQEFEKRKAELEKEHTCMQMSSWDIGEATGTRLSIASIGSALVFTESIGSVHVLALSHPSLISLELFGMFADLVPVTLCLAFVVLSRSNMRYYLDIKTPDDHSRVRIVNLLPWYTLRYTRSILIAPIGLALLFYSMPVAVIFTAFSHSVYTFVERKTIELVVKVPRSGRFSGQRQVVQWYNRKT